MQYRFNIHFLTFTLHENFGFLGSGATQSDQGTGVLSRQRNSVFRCCDEFRALNVSQSSIDRVVLTIDTNQILKVGSNQISHMNDSWHLEE